MKQKGSIYFLTLASSIILVMTIIGLSFGIIQYRKTSRADNQIDQTEIYAQLGIRHALYFTHQVPNWRDLLANGAWMMDVSNGNGTYSVAGMDQFDGTLNNGDEPVALTSMANVNDIQRIVTVMAEQPPLEILKYAASASGDIFFDNQAFINGDIISNSNIYNTGGSTIINGNVEAVGTVSGLTNINGTVSENIESKTFPSVDSISSYYVAKATAITHQSTIQRMVFSPFSNPLGMTNAEGIYMINCNGQKVDIRDCRIAGTLILINPREDSCIESGLNWQSVQADYPALIVLQGGIIIKPTIDLSEADTGTDYSLPGEPGRGSLTDVYPNQVHGAIYCNGNLYLQEHASINGTVMVNGNLYIQTNSVIEFNSLLTSAPPKQFNETYLEPTQGTWQELTF